jgi:hypothetical protein
MMLPLNVDGGIGIAIVLSEYNTLNIPMIAHAAVRGGDHWVVPAPRTALRAL